MTVCQLLRALLRMSEKQAGCRGCHIVSQPCTSSAGMHMKCGKEAHSMEAMVHTVAARSVPFSNYRR